ncbi:hypothetical protein GCM10009558_009080 [Virgisporangium aurantiacum]
MTWRTHDWGRRGRTQAPDHLARVDVGTALYEPPVEQRGGRLDPLHRAHSTARVGVARPQVDGLDIELVPVPAMTVDGEPGMIKRIKHGDSSFGPPDTVHRSAQPSAWR